MSLRLQECRQCISMRSAKWVVFVYKNTPQRTPLCLFWAQVCSLKDAALLSCMSPQPGSSETSSVARVQEVITKHLPQHTGTWQPSLPGNLAENLDIILSKVPFSGKGKSLLECGKWFPVELGDIPQCLSVLGVGQAPGKFTRCTLLHEHKPHSLLPHER